MRWGLASHKHPITSAMFGSPLPCWGNVSPEDRGHGDTLRDNQTGLHPVCHLASSGRSQSSAEAVS